MSTFRILYPERRVVSSEQVMTWYTDALANEEVEDLGPCSAHQAAQALHEAGLITLTPIQVSDNHYDVQSG